MHGNLEVKLVTIKKSESESSVVTVPAERNAKRRKKLVESHLLIPRSQSSL